MRPPPLLAPATARPPAPLPHVRSRPAPAPVQGGGPSPEATVLQARRGAEAALDFRAAGRVS